MERHPLHTERLRLEPTTEGHAALVYRQVTDPRLWTFFPDLRPKSLDDLHLLYRKWERGNPYADGDEIWENWVCFLSGTQIPVGSAQATILGDGGALIAYMFYVEHHGKGYAREAAAAVIAHLHEAHGVARVIAEMDTRNERSRKLVEALGFVRVEKRPDEYVYRLDLAPVAI